MTRKRRRNRLPRTSPILLFGVLALGATVVLYELIATQTAWRPYVTWLVACSGATFLLYGWDKAQAGINKTRVPEKVLHGLALAGGFAGGWAGMYLFRHKTRSSEFRTVLLLSTVLHAGLAYLWLLK